MLQFQKLHNFINYCISFWQPPLWIL